MHNSTQSLHPLVNSVIALSQAAHAFNKIEEVFMTTEPDPLFLHTLCQTYLNDYDNDELLIRLPATHPTQFREIRKSFNPLTSEWHKSIKTCEISRAEIEERLHEFHRFFYVSDNTMIDEYLARQSYFYSASETKSEAQADEKESSQKSTETINLLSDLKDILQKYAPLLLGSVDQVVNRIYEIIHRNIANGKNMTLADQQCWRSLALSIFKGCDLLGNSDALELRSDLLTIASFCLALQKAILKPITPTERLSVSSATISAPRSQYPLSIFRLAFSLPSEIAEVEQGSPEMGSQNEHSSSLSKANNH